MGKIEGLTLGFEKVASSFVGFNPATEGNHQN